MNVVELKDVSFHRNGRDILAEVSWAIRKGEHWALLGANGSGKTTLLKIVTGYEWATTGAVSVLGRHYGECDLRELRKHIGWVSSSLEHRVPLTDTALEVVVSGLDASLGTYRSFSDAEVAKATDALDALGASSLTDARYGILSQGEQQRVLIARALAASPALLILDEPCIGLDPAARREFLDDLAALAARADAPTMVLVTHHVEEIGPWIGKALVLKEGRVLAKGATRDTLTGPTLGDAFSLPCDLKWDDGRCYLRPL
ncbi:MAG: ABC transporter ATP-binding protein [bacterium]|nr:ABC transporter ATP-binding protein [bacterium]